MPSPSERRPRPSAAPRLAVFLAAGALALLAPAAAQPAAFVPPAVAERSVAQVQADLIAGRATSASLTRAYLARIARIDRSGPNLRSVIVTSPRALAEANEADRRRAAGKPRGPLDGIPVLVKDNIDVADGTATTAGSLALAANVARRDAALIVRLRRAGAVMLGKTNLSEWANFRSNGSISGWSGVGGLVKNPYALDRTACGSSSGTGAAIAASLATVGVGTETDGSVTCPSSINGLAGLKPTLGLVSRSGVVPISHDQDTPGPMGRSVADIAVLLDAMAGSDPRDPATREADRYRTNFAAAAAAGSLRGKRLGIALSGADAGDPQLAAVFAHAVAALRRAGATVVDTGRLPRNPALGDAEGLTLLVDFRTDIDAYLATTPPAVRSRSLAALIAFNRRSARERALFGQDVFVDALHAPAPTSAAYRSARAICRTAAGPNGIDRILSRYRLDALIAPTAGPASRIDIVDGDKVGGGAIGSLAAVAGYPHLTVPMGLLKGLPVGLSFVGTKWSDARLLALGAAYERAARAREAPRYLPSLETTPRVRDAFAAVRLGVPAPAR